MSRGAAALECMADGFSSRLIVPAFSGLYLESSFRQIYVGGPWTIRLPINSAIKLPINNLSSRLVDCIDAQLQRESFALPLLPEVATRVLAMTSDETCSAADISRLIHQDQRLAGNVLKIANSARYTSDIRIVSLQQAITRLGFRTIGEIALTLSLQNDIFQACGFEAEIRRIWEHALASASYAREIARMKRTNVESAYLCGLLHTVGKPVILNMLSTDPAARTADVTAATVDDVLSARHVAVGARVVETWALPEQISVSIQYYQRCDQAPKFANVAMITCLADLAASNLIDPDGPTSDCIRSHPVIEALNFYPDDVDRVFALSEAIRDLINAVSA